ncbi:MAG: hypothetical protein MJZ51_07365, partial [Bacteroidales bacterium]|nr:hypothetical protein [Bacteroidales bacterium]
MISIVPSTKKVEKSTSKLPFTRQKKNHPNIFSKKITATNQAVSIKNGPKEKKIFCSLEKGRIFALA